MRNIEFPENVIFGNSILLRNDTKFELLVYVSEGESPNKVSTEFIKASPVEKVRNAFRKCDRKWRVASIGPHDQEKMTIDGKFCRVTSFIRLYTSFKCNDEVVRLEDNRLVEERQVIFFDNDCAGKCVSERCDFLARQQK